MANTKPTRKPTTAKATSKKANIENYGKTIFLNFGLNFNGTKAKGTAYLNINNIFYDKDDTKDKLKSIRKAFSESKTYNLTTDILHEELSKAMKKAEQKINKKLKKMDRELEENEKKNISVFLSANVYDGNSKEDTNNIVF